MSDVSVKVDGNNLVITVPMHTPRPSTSGKTMIVASTGGFKKTEAVSGNKTISVSVNATIPSV